MARAVTDVTSFVPDLGGEGVFALCEEPPEQRGPPSHPKTGIPGEGSIFKYKSILDLINQ
jgi:hypothetical protein